MDTLCSVAVTVPQRLRMPSTTALAVAGAAAGLGVVLLATSVGVRAGLAPATLARQFGILFAVGGAAALGLLALLRFRAFLLVLFAVRPVLDAFKGAGGSAGVLDPSLAIGGLFLAAAVVWLYAQHAGGLLRPMSRTSWALCLLVLAHCVSVLASTSPVASGTAAAKVASGALMFVVLEQVLHQTPRYTRPLFLAAAASLAVPAVVACVQVVQRGGFTGTARINGTFVHPNSFASYLVILGLAALALSPHLAGRERTAARATAVVSLPLLVLTSGRAAWLAFLVGVLIIGAVQSKRLIAGCLLGVVLAVSVVPGVTDRFADLGQERQVGRGDPNSLAFRFRYWQAIAPMANSTPIVGIGPDMVERSRPEKLQPHNTFLQAYVETGAVGLLALLGVVWAVAKDLRAALRRGLGRPAGVAVAGLAAAVAFGVQLGTENLLLQVLVLWYLAVPVSAALALNRVAVGR